VLLDIERFKDEKFEFFKARSEYWRFVEVDFVAWTGLEMTAEVEVWVIYVCLDEISSG